jgi:hypothetical protein
MAFVVYIASSISGCYHDSLLSVSSSKVGLKRRNAMVEFHMKNHLNARL